jgi:hypothetical protein
MVWPGIVIFATQIHIFINKESLFNAALSFVLTDWLNPISLFIFYFHHSNLCMLLRELKPASEPCLVLFLHTELELLIFYIVPQHFLTVKSMIMGCPWSEYILTRVNFDRIKTDRINFVAVWKRQYKLTVSKVLHIVPVRYCTVRYQPIRKRKCTIRLFFH